MPSPRPTADRLTAAKLEIYRALADRGRAPSAGEVAAALGCAESEAVSAFRGLAGQRLLVLEPDGATIRMAPPFSAIETAFRVVSGGTGYWANCVWDALGVAAALGRDADVATTCGDCGEPMRLAVRDGTPVAVPCAIHFAVPAAHWWDDIVHT